MGIKNLFVLDRMKEFIGKTADKDLAGDLGISPQAVSNARTKGEVPADMILNFAEKHELSVDWLIYGSVDKVNATDMPLVIASSPLPVYSSNKNGVSPDTNKRIIDLIRRLDLSDDDFCRRLEINRDVLSNIRAGGSISGVMMRAICYEFNIRMRWLRDGEEPIRQRNEIQ